jgi:hypothetical protein
MEHEKTPNGIMFTEEIISCNGASFMLFPTASDTAEMIAAAKYWLKDNRDVVSLSVAKDADWDEWYRGEIFRNPAVRHLRWYEINADLPTVQIERKKGTSVADYIERLVLPYTAEVKSKCLEKHGEKIYQW